MVLLYTCWLVDPWKPSREKYLEAWRDLGWDVVLWTDAQRSGLVRSPVEGVQLRDAAEITTNAAIADAYAYAVHHMNHGTAADLFRYEVLTQCGGAYADLDVMPAAALTPARLPAFEPRFNYCHRKQIEIRFVSSPLRNHPLLGVLRDTAVANERSFIEQGGWNQLDATMVGVLHRTGPDMARPVVEAYAAASGKTLLDYLLRDVINDATEEGEEHYVVKLAAARHIAAMDLLPR